jgi:hypothetical protein
MSFFKLLILFLYLGVVLAQIKLSIEFFLKFILKVLDEHRVLSFFKTSYVTLGGKAHFFVLFFLVCNSLSRFIEKFSILVENLFSDVNAKVTLTLIQVKKIQGLVTLETDL